MATAKRKEKKTAKRPQLATSSLLEVRKAMTEGKDVVLVPGTLKRPEVRVRHDGLNRIYEIDRFGFLAYRPNAHSVRYHVFVDGEYAFVERGRLDAAMIEAVAYASLVYVNPDGRPHLASAACDVLHIANH
jgi:hypothetical protein